PTGQVLFWNDLQQNEIRLWDPTTGIISTPALPDDDIFCSGHSFMANGKLFVAGGHLDDDVGLPVADIYDPFTNVWTHLPDMNAGRWYPTNTTLGNGDVLVTSGDITPSNPDPVPQVWQVAQGTWRDLTGAIRVLPFYPFMFVAPNGKVFDAGPAQDTYYLNTTGKGAWTFLDNSHFGLRLTGSAVMYDAGKILIVGGFDPPTNTAEVIDLNALTPIWQDTSPMAYARRHLNAVLLADGKVVAIGGTSSPGFNDPTDAVLAAEIWDPETGNWSTMAAMQLKRMYHSTAVLLP